MAGDELFTHSFNEGIHYITAHHNSAEALNAILEHVGSLFIGVPMSEKVRIVLNFHQVPTPPISQWLMPIVSFFRRQGPETGHPARVVYFYSRGSRGSALNIFLSIQRFLPQRVSLRFFSKEEEEQALQWLRIG